MTPHMDREGNPEQQAQVDIVLLSALDAALQAAAAGGTTRAYFEQKRGWESRMRGDFLALGEAWRQGGEAKMDAALLRDLNAKYKTRHPFAALTPLLESTLCALEEQGWRTGEVPPLFNCTDEEANALTQVVQRVLQLCAACGSKRPYSLTTKLLHFLYPDTFVIYDRQAGHAIQSYTNKALSHLSPRTNPRRQYRVVSLGDTSGAGYRGVVNFYWFLLDAAQRHGRMGELQQAANKLEALAQSPPGDARARVTVLDVVDKYLWKATAKLFAS